MIYSELIDMAMHELNMNKSNFANSIGISVTTLNRILSNKSLLPSSKVLFMLDKLGVDVSRLDYNEVYHNFLAENYGNEYCWVDDIENECVNLRHSACGNVFSISLDSIAERGMLCPHCKAKSHIKYSKGLEFDVRENGAWIKGIGTCTDAVLIIPTTLKENIVVGIESNAFAKCESITQVIIPGSVETIGYRAFAECINLETVELQNGLKEILGSAFEECSKLTSITIPATVTLVASGDGELSAEEQLLRAIFGEKAGGGYNPFSKCSRLTSIKVDRNNLFYHDYENCLIETKTKKLISGCSNSILPTNNSVEIIGSYAFSGCSGTKHTENLQYTKIKVIQDHAFSSCDEVEILTFPASLTTVEYRAFSSCKQLYKVTFAHNLTSLALFSFEECHNLTILDFGKTANSLVIGTCAFLNCESLMKITFPNNLLKIESAAFRNCRNITRLDFPQSLQIIETEAFDNCVNLENVFIPKNVSEIEISAFSNCAKSLGCIECEIDIKPKLWNPKWNQIDATGEEYYKIRWGIKKQN